MKIALLLSVPLISASVFAAATTQSSNTFGLLRVDSTQKQTIVCVPWVAASATDDQPIPVTDIVKTANLTVGDELFWYDSTAKNYKAWTLVSGGEGKAPEWQAASSVTPSGVTPGTPAEDIGVSRGNAIILVRQNPTDGEGKAKPFYLLGQVAKSSTAVANALPHGAYSLLAPPSVTDVAFDLNSATWTTPDSKDAIIIPGTNVTLSWNAAESEWGTYKMVLKNNEKQEIWNYDVATVPAGCGAWYVSKGNNDVTVTWTK